MSESPNDQPPNDDRESHTESSSGADRESQHARGRDVVVPLRLYKTVTVFSTLIAICAVIAGFALLDAATNQFTILTGLLGILGVGLPFSEGTQTVVFALLGMGCIAFGGGVYVFGTRFRAAEMGKDKDSEDPTSDNG